MVIFWFSRIVNVVEIIELIRLIFFLQEPLKTFYLFRETLDNIF